MSVSSGSSSSSRSQSTADARSRKSSVSGWTNSGTRSKERRIPNTAAWKFMTWSLGARHSRVGRVRVYEDTYKRDLDSFSDHHRVETKKEVGGCFVGISAGRTSHSSHRRDDKSYTKGSHRRHGNPHYSEDDDDDDDEEEEDASERSYGQPVPAPAGGPASNGPMRGPYPPPPPAGYPGHPGHPPPGFAGRPGPGPIPAQYVRPPPGPGGMSRPGVPGFRPPQPQPHGFAQR